MASLPCPLNRRDNHGRVGTARMPYPPTISLKNLFFCSYVLQNMYLLSNVTCLSKKHVLMFLCLTKKTCPYVLLSLNTRSHVFTTKKRFETSTPYSEPSIYQLIYNYSSSVVSAACSSISFCCKSLGTSS